MPGTMARMKDSFGVGSSPVVHSIAVVRNSIFPIVRPLRETSTVS